VNGSLALAKQGGKDSSAILFGQKFFSLFPQLRNLHVLACHLIAILYLRPAFLNLKFISQ